MLGVRGLHDQSGHGPTGDACKSSIACSRGRKPGVARMSTGAAARAAQHHIFGCRTMALRRLLAGRTSNFLVPEGRWHPSCSLLFWASPALGDRLHAMSFWLCFFRKKHGAL